MAGVTRSHFEHFLIGKSSDTLTDSGKYKLPLARDVMKYLFHRKSLDKFKGQALKSVIICPLKTGTKEANCLAEGGCSNAGNLEEIKCVVSMIKEEGHWLESGLPIVSDYAIFTKVEKLFKDHQNLSKTKSRQTPTEISKREKYSGVLDNLFDITQSEWENILKMDKCRSEEAKMEDKAFLDDQKNKRLMVVGDRDKGYDKAVNRKIVREGRLNKPRYIFYMYFRSPSTAWDQWH